MANLSVNISTLADRAVLVKFTKRVFTPYKKDKQATKTVEDTYGVKAGSYNKKILATSLEFTNALRAAHEAYQYYFSNTSPWLDEEGQRMLRSDRIFEFTQELNALIAKANYAFDGLEINWNQIVATDVMRLGALGNPEDYPDHVRDYFDLSYVLRPVPSAGDFRIPIPQEELDKITRAHDEAEKAVMRDTIERLMEPIAAAAKRLAEYSKGADEGKKQRFHESVLLNIGEQTKMARKLNITNDIQLEQMCDEIDQLMAPHITAPDQVKDDSEVRAAAQRKLDDIMSKMNGWM